MAHRSSDFATSINAMIPDRFLCRPGAKRSSIRDRGSAPFLRYVVQAHLLSSSASILISSSRRLCSESLGSHNHSQFIFQGDDVLYTQELPSNLANAQAMNLRLTTAFQRGDGTYSPKKGSLTGSYLKLHWLPSPSS